MFAADMDDIPIKTILQLWRVEAMKTQNQCLILSTVFLLAFVWNVLCLFGFLPLKFYILSLVVVVLGNFLNIMIACRTTEQESHKNNKKNIPVFVMFLCIAVAWLTTLIACIVYPR